MAEQKQSVDIRQVVEQAGREAYIKEHGKETYEAKERLEEAAGIGGGGGGGRVSTSRQTENQRQTERQTEIKNIKQETEQRIRDLKQRSQEQLRGLSLQEKQQMQQDLQEQIRSIRDMKDIQIKKIKGGKADTSPIGGYTPVYDKGKLQGFRKGGEFVPESAAVTDKGAYKPQEIEFTRSKGTTYVEADTGEKLGKGTITEYAGPGGQDITRYERPDETIAVAVGNIPGRRGRTKAEYKVIESGGPTVGQWEESVREAGKTPRQIKKDRGVYGDILGYYGQAEEYASNLFFPKKPKTLMQVAPALLGKVIESEKTKEVISTAVTKSRQFSPLITETEKRSKKVGEFFTGATLGTVRDIKRKPIKQGLLFGAGYGVGFGTSAVRGAATSVAGQTGGRIVSGGLAGAGVYLGVGYVSGKLKDIQKQVGEGDYYSVGRTVGVGIKDVGIIGLGTSYGAKSYLKLESKIRTMGRKQVPTEDIVMKQSLEGEKYPTAKPKTHLEEFKYRSQRLPGYKTKTFTRPGYFIKKLTGEDISLFGKEQLGPPMLYHATSTFGGLTKGGKTFQASAGTSEYPGLFGASGVAPHYLRVDGGSRYSLSPFSELLYTKKPGVLAVIPDKFAVGTYTWRQYAAGTKPSPGTAYVPGPVGGGPEVQAILPGEPTGEIIGRNLYFQQGGINIPIDVARYTGTDVGGISMGDLAVSGSYGGLPSYSITDIRGISLLGITSKQISRTTPKTYKISSKSYAPTKTSISYSFKPSKSYTPPPSISSGRRIARKSSILSSTKSSKKYYPSTKKPKSYFKTTPYKPDYTPPPSPPPAKKSKSYPSKPKIIKQEGKFKVFSKRRGKWIKLGEFSTLAKAKQKGVGFVKKTLAASLKITKAGKPVKLKLSPMFRKAKTMKGTYVQKKTKVMGFGSRLGSKSEVLEIMKSKKGSSPLRSKGKSKRLLGSLNKKTKGRGIFKNKNSGGVNWLK